ncbi:DNA polymerase IV [Methylocapsa sp. S129]|uniref:DNA polymerase IV n=1 Tax=Methylocapsa sp. S129 TaxID=1641869 RepID=UPI001FEF0883|nr:DNA polymerase IV [Methylocapsa sp. S129]
MISHGAEGARVVLCRDCLVESPGGDSSRCALCGSPRLVAYPHGNALTIAHIDCDAFYASIEKRDNPTLWDRPLIVGGGRRGVVSTCCYVARTFGVRSAMPMFQALKLCPEAVVIGPDMAKYVRVGRQIRSLMQDLTPLVEPISIDEAFLDLTGCEGVHGAGAPLTLARLARKIESEIGLTVSIGLSDCKFLAKLASDLDKPRGYTIVERVQAMALLAPMPVSRIWGVGKVAQTRLNNAGLRLIGDIQALDETTMFARHGAEGGRLWRLARGIDKRRVTPERETKSISSETTFDVDTADKEHLTRTLLVMCERVAARLKKQQLACKSVTLKLRTADFKLRTRARSGFEPTQLATRLFLVARSLLEKELDGARFRLLGVSTADFAAAEGADQGDLVDKDIGRERAREDAIDSLREKFGASAVVRGLAFKATTPKRP